VPPLSTITVKISGSI